MIVVGRVHSEVSLNSLLGNDRVESTQAFQHCLLPPLLELLAFLDRVIVPQKSDNCSYDQKTKHEHHTLKAAHLLPLGTVNPAMVPHHLAL